MSKPTIAIDGRPFSGGYSGYTTYLQSIIEPLLQRGFAVTLLSNTPFNPAHSITQNCHMVMFGSRRNSWWEQVDVANYLASHHVDLYFVGTNRGLPWRKTRGTRYILGLLDVIPYLFPKHYLVHPHFVLRELRPVAQLGSIARADEIITISQQSARDIRRLFHRSATALLLRLEATKDPLTKPSHKPQFVYVGGVDQRKKIAVLLRAFATFRQHHPEYHLVLIGNGYTAFNGLVSELGIQDGVTMTGYISETAKTQTIAASTALVYLSVYEGYGLAIAEGFAAGVPVIAGAGGSQREIGGEGVLYVDPTNPTTVTAAMEEVLQPSIQQRLAQGRKQQLPHLFGPQVETAITTFFEAQVTLARQAR